MPGQRIEKLSFEMLTPRLRGLLGAKVERLGYLGEFFQYTAHQPEVLASFLEMTDHLKSALDDRLTELGALTVATSKGNRYELHQHERLSRKLGFTLGWIEAVERLDPDGSSELSRTDRAAQRLAIAMMQGQGRDGSEQLSDLVREIGPDDAIAFMFLIGRYITHAMIVTALEIEPPVSSVFEEKRS